MLEPQKPVTERDLPIPFERIGEDGWADRVRDMLRSYGVPCPLPASLEEVTVAETRLAVTLPVGYRMLLLDLGPLDLGSIRFLPTSEVTKLTDYWFRSAFASSDAAQLGNHLAIADYCGSGDFIGLNLETGECARCGHDPPGFSAPLPSVDALVQYAFMSLPLGQYGWDDAALEDLVEHALQRRFGVRL
jgi:hypothetical protein